MPIQLNDIPTELCFYISLHVAEPTALSLTNHYFHTMITAPDFFATHLLYRYGRAHALFVAIRDHPCQLTPAVIKYLRAKGAILPCILVQNLGYGLKELQREKNMMLERMEAERIKNMLLEELRATMYSLEDEQREENQENIGQTLRRKDHSRVNWSSSGNANPNNQVNWETYEVNIDDSENYIDTPDLITLSGSESSDDGEDGEYDYDDDDGCMFPSLVIGENLSKSACDAIFEWGRDLYALSNISNLHGDSGEARHWDDDELMDIMTEHIWHAVPIPQELRDEVKAKVLEFIISKNFLPLPFTDPTIRNHTIPSIKDAQSSYLSIPEGVFSRLKGRKPIETGLEMEEAELQYGDDFQVLVMLLRHFPEIVEEQLIRNMGFDFEQLDIDLFLFSVLQCEDIELDEPPEVVTTAFENMMKIAPNIRPSPRLICCVLALADEYEHDIINAIVKTLQYYAPPEIDFAELATIAGIQRPQVFELGDVFHELGLLSLSR